MVRKCLSLAIGMAVFGLAACQDVPTELQDGGRLTPESAVKKGPSQAEETDPWAALAVRYGGDGPYAFMDAVNRDLAGTGLFLDRMELIVTSAGAEHMPTVFAANHTLRLSSRWVPGDTRRREDAADNVITQGSFAPFMVATGPAGAIAAEPAVNASFDTWNAVGCTELDVVETEFAAGVFPSAIFGLTGFTNDIFAADISTIGWLPGFIFDIFLDDPADPDDKPSEFVLGVTFTFIWGTNTPAGFIPSDVDNNNRTDTALKEIWYNDAFPWSTAGGGIDIETVALHENGHAMELGHFGLLQRNPDGKLIISPRAVMNAIYAGVLQSPEGTDDAAYCGNFSQWPSN